MKTAILAIVIPLLCASVARAQDARPTKRDVLDRLNRLLADGFRVEEGGSTATGRIAGEKEPPLSSRLQEDAKKLRSLLEDEATYRGLVERGQGGEAFLKEAQAKLDSTRAQIKEIRDANPDLLREADRELENHKRWLEAGKRLREARNALEECLADKLWRNDNAPSSPEAGARIVQAEIKAAEALLAAAEFFRSQAAAQAGDILGRALEGMAGALEELARRLQDADRSIVRHLEGPVREHLQRLLDRLALRFVPLRGLRPGDARAAAQEELRELRQKMAELQSRIDAVNAIDTLDAIRQYQALLDELYALETAIDRKTSELEKKYNISADEPDPSKASATLFVDADREFEPGLTATVWVNNRRTDKPFSLKPGEIAVIAVAVAAVVGGTTWYLLKGGGKPLRVAKDAALQLNPGRPAVLEVPGNGDVHLRTSETVRPLDVLLRDPKTGSLIAAAPEVTAQEIAAAKPTIVVIDRQTGREEEISIGLVGLLPQFSQEETSTGSAVRLSLTAIGANNLPDGTKVRITIDLSAGLRFEDLSRHEAIETTLGQARQGIHRLVTTTAGGPQVAEVKMEVLQ